MRQPFERLGDLVDIHASEAIKAQQRAPKMVTLRNLRTSKASATLYIVVLSNLATLPISMKRRPPSNRPFVSPRIGHRDKPTHLNSPFEVSLSVLATSLILMNDHRTAASRSVSPKSLDISPTSSTTSDPPCDVDLSVSCDLVDLDETITAYHRAHSTLSHSASFSHDTGNTHTLH